MHLCAFLCTKERLFRGAAIACGRDGFVPCLMFSFQRTRASVLVCCPAHTLACARQAGSVRRARGPVLMGFGFLAERPYAQPDDLIAADDRGVRGGQPLEAATRPPPWRSSIVEYASPRISVALSTLHQHRPKSHQAHLEWTPSRLINWAATVGPASWRNWPGPGLRSACWPYGTAYRDCSPPAREGQGDQRRPVPRSRACTGDSLRYGGILRDLH